MSIDATGIDSPLIPDERVALDTSSPLETAARLKLVRDAFGFSQRELAKRAGMTNSSISMIEQGQVSPSIQSLTRILSAFPLSLADFFSFNPSTHEACVYRTGSLRPATDNSGLARRSFGAPDSTLDARIEGLPAGYSTSFSLAGVDTCGLVLEGKVQLTLISGSELLTVGDGFYIPAYQLYQLSNSCASECRLFRCSVFAHKG